MRAECDLIVDDVDIVLHFLAYECRAHVIIWICVGSRTALLHPIKCVLYAIDPGGVLCDALLGIGGRGDNEAKIAPVCTATTGLICAC